MRPERNSITVEGRTYIIHTAGKYEAQICDRCALQQLCLEKFTNEGICQVFDAHFNQYFVRI